MHSQHALQHDRTEAPTKWLFREEKIEGTTYQHCLHFLVWRHAHRNPKQLYVCL